MIAFSEELFWLVLGEEDQRKGSDRGAVSKSTVKLDRRDADVNKTGADNASVKIFALSF